MEYKIVDHEESLPLSEFEKLPRPRCFADLTTDEHLDIIEALLKDVLKILNSTESEQEVS